jgi:hypothetical protein
LIQEIEAMRVRPAWATLLGVAALLGAAASANADAVTFASYKLNAATVQPMFQYTTTGSSATFSQINAGGALVDFSYAAGATQFKSGFTAAEIAQLLMTNKANLTVSITTTQHAQFDSIVKYDVQPFMSGTFSINLVTAIAGKTNLLSGTMDSALLYGKQGGTVGNLTAQNDPPPGDNLQFTSDFLKFNGASQNALAWTLSGINPKLGITGNFLNPFKASGTGSFQYSPVPEPGTLALAGVALPLLGLAFLRRRMRSRR